MGLVGVAPQRAQHPGLRSLSALWPLGPAPRRPVLRGQTSGLPVMFPAAEEVREEGKAEKEAGDQGRQACLCCREDSGEVLPAHLLLMLPTPSACLAGPSAEIVTTDRSLSGKALPLVSNRKPSRVG